VNEGGAPKSLSLSGDVVDISSGGIGLMTDYPLEPGHLISFDSQLDEVVHKTGIVKWTTATAGNYLHRAGVEFVRG
jgi:hypothetical protein